VSHDRETRNGKRETGNVDLVWSDDQQLSLSSSL